MEMRNIFASIKSKYKFSSGGLTVKEKFALAFPGPAAAIGNIIIHNGLMKYYTDIIGIDPKYIGWIYFIFNLWNAVNDPLLGVYVDKFRFRPNRGKYVYLMRVTAPLMIFFTFVMLFSSPAWQDWVIFIVLLVELFIYDTAYTIYNVSYQSYFLVAAPTTEERIDVEVIRGYLGNILGFMGTIVPTLLLVGNSNRALIIPVFTLVIGINALAYIFALRTLKDKEDMYKQLKHQQQPEYENASHIWKESFEIVKSKPFWTYLLYSITSRGAMAYYFTPFLYYMDKVIKSSGIVATIADVGPGLVVLAVLPVIGNYTKKIGSKNMVILSFFPAAIGFGALLFITEGWQAIICYIFIVFSLYLSGTANISITGALIDDNEQRTGIRKTGLYNGLFALFATTFVSFQSIIFTNIISYFGYDGSAAVQTERAILGIRIGAGLVPIIMGAIGLIPIILFPINKKREKELSEFSASMRRGNVNKDEKTDRIEKT